MANKFFAYVLNPFTNQYELRDLDEVFQPRTSADAIWGEDTNFSENWNDLRNKYHPITKEGSLWHQLYNDGTTVLEGDYYPDTVKMTDDGTDLTLYFAALGSIEYVPPARNVEFLCGVGTSNTGTLQWNDGTSELPGTTPPELITYTIQRSTTASFDNPDTIVEDLDVFGQTQPYEYSIPKYRYWTYVRIIAKGIRKSSAWIDTIGCYSTVVARMTASPTPGRLYEISISANNRDEFIGKTVNFFRSTDINTGLLPNNFTFVEADQTISFIDTADGAGIDERITYNLYDVNDKSIPLLTASAIPQQLLEPSISPAGASPDPIGANFTISYNANEIDTAASFEIDHALQESGLDGNPELSGLSVGTITISETSQNTNVYAKTRLTCSYYPLRKSVWSISAVQVTGNDLPWVKIYASPDVYYTGGEGENPLLEKIKVDVEVGPTTSTSYDIRVKYNPTGTDISGLESWTGGGDINGIYSKNDFPFENWDPGTYGITMKFSAQAVQGGYYSAHGPDYDTGLAIESLSSKRYSLNAHAFVGHIVTSVFLWDSNSSKRLPGIYDTGAYFDPEIGGAIIYKFNASYYKKLEIQRKEGIGSFATIATFTPNNNWDVGNGVLQFVDSNVSEGSNYTYQSVITYEYEGTTPATITETTSSLSPLLDLSDDGALAAPWIPPLDFSKPEWYASTAGWGEAWAVARVKQKLISGATKYYLYNSTSVPVFDTGYKSKVIGSSSYAEHVLMGVPNTTYDLWLRASAGPEEFKTSNVYDGGAIDLYTKSSATPVSSSVGHPGQIQLGFPEDKYTASVASGPGHVNAPDKQFDDYDYSEFGDVRGRLKAWYFDCANTTSRYHKIYTINNFLTIGGNEYHEPLVGANIDNYCAGVVIDGVVSSSLSMRAATPPGIYPLDFFVPTDTGVVNTSKVILFSVWAIKISPYAARYGLAQRGDMFLHVEIKIDFSTDPRPTGWVAADQVW